MPESLHMSRPPHLPPPLPPPLPPRARPAMTKPQPVPGLPTTQQPAPVVRPPVAAFSTTSGTSIDAAAGTLPAGFLEALRKVVPKRRRLKARYVVGLGVLTVTVVLGVDPSMREFASARWHRRPVAAPAGTTAAQRVATTPPPTLAAAEATTAVPVANPVTTMVPSTTDPPAMAATPKKTRPGRTAPRAAEKHASKSAAKTPD
jgi:hypothetical protein